MGSSSGGSLNGEPSPSIGLTGFESLKGSRCDRCDVGVWGLFELREPLLPPSITYGGGALCCSQWPLRMCVSCCTRWVSWTMSCGNSITVGRRDFLETVDAWIVALVATLASVAPRTACFSTSNAVSTRKATSHKHFIPKRENP